MNAPKRINWESGLAIVAVLALCIATDAFGQSPNSNHGQALGLGKLEPALEVLNISNTDPNAVAGVIVQFLEDEEIAGPWKSTQELKKAAKEARKQAIADAGGEPGLEFDNFPIHAAKLTYGALKRLDKHQIGRAH